MRKPTRILGVILARGGSKRIPLKNVKRLAGKPLISYMIEAALESHLLDRVIVSTDHDEIEYIAKYYGADVPFKRPAHLCTDDCPSEPAIQHAVEFVENKQGDKIDTVVNLQCTSPFTTTYDIDRCIWSFLNKRLWYNSVVSVREVTERPEHMFVLGDDLYPKLLIDEPIKGERCIPRNLPKMVVLNGAIYVTKRDKLMEDDTMMAPNIGVYIMPYERSFDIDTPTDFLIADFFMRTEPWK